MYLIMCEIMCIFMYICMYVYKSFKGSPLTYPHISNTGT
jgi:hypothetical protein